MHQMVHHVDRKQSEQGPGTGVNRQIWIDLSLHQSRDEACDPNDEIDDAHDEGKPAGHQALAPPLWSARLKVMPSRLRQSASQASSGNSLVPPHLTERLRDLTTIRVASARGRVSADAVETDGALHRPLTHRPCQTSQPGAVSRFGERMARQV